MDELFKRLQDENQTGNDAWMTQFIQHWRDLSEAERKAMLELDEVRSKILTKETEISLLHADVNMLSVDRDNKIVEIEDLTSQLRRIQKENETSLATVQSIEIELTTLRGKNSQLSSDILKKAEQLRLTEERGCLDEKTLKDFQSRIKLLEKKVESLELEEKRLTEEHEAVESEREEEFRALQNALDDALEEKIKLQNKFDCDFKAFRSSCSAQENQLMDDFEWKLRQIESTCKKKLHEKDRQVEEKLKELRSGAEKDLSEEKEKLQQEKVQVEEQMRQVSHFKSYEVELIQLRGLTHEQQKCMRSASRQIEHLKFAEKLARDDIRTIKALLEKEKNNLVVVQASHQHKLENQEENIHSKLGKQINEITAKFEGECSRLKQDLCKQYAEEKHSAVESMRLLKDQEISSAKQGWERQRQELIQEICKLKDTITEKEGWGIREVEKVRTKADRESWELRRKMEKESSAHTELIEELKDTQKDELDSLRKQYEVVADRLREVEKKLVEAERSQRKLANYEASLNTKHSSGPHANPVNKSDSGCGDDVSEEYEEEDDEDADAEDNSDEEPDEEEDVISEANKSPKLITGNESSASSSCSEHVEETVVTNLREEVANLQGSIEKLTSTLTTEGAAEASAPAKSNSSGEEVSSSESDDDDE